MFKKITKNRMVAFGLVWVLLLFITAVFAPVFAPYPPDKINVSEILLPPSPVHLLGTDALGRDLLSRMIWGSRISLFVGFVAVGIAVIIGVFLGSIAGFYGRALDTVIMRFVDIMLCFPTFFLILAVIAFLEPSIWNIMVVIGLTGWMDVTRLIRAEILSLKEQDFIKAARTLGASSSRIITKHLIPNAITPVLVSATFGVAGAILVESSLSFLGIGVPPPDASWGNILASSKDNLEIAWWLSLFPGAAIFITILGYNLLGEGIREMLDPRRAGR